MTQQGLASIGGGGGAGAVSSVFTRTGAVTAQSGDYTAAQVTGAMAAATYDPAAIAQQVVGTSATQTLTNKTLTSPVIATITNTGTLTLPTSTDTIVGRATTDTLTNKTLTSPVIGTIVNTGTLTLPTSTDTIVGRATTDTLTNKRVTKRVGSTASSATPTINTDNVDVYKLTAQAAAITSFTTNLSGTPNDADSLIIQITDNGTARGITWGTGFEASGTVALPTTTVISTLLSVGFLYNAVTSKWRCVAVA